MFSTKKNISIIRTSGKGEFYKYIKILNKCEIPYFALADRDCFFNGINNIIDEIKSIDDSIKVDIKTFATNVHQNSDIGYKGMKTIKERTIQPNLTIDAKSLCDSLERLEYYQDEFHVNKVLEVWQHLKPNIKKKDVISYMKKQGLYDRFLEYQQLLWDNNIYILLHGELENYYTDVAKQIQGGKEEKIINIIKNINENNDITHFLKIEEYQIFIEKVLSS